MQAPLVIDNRYELGAVLGVGGSGRVWRAHDRVTGAKVAFKLVGVDSERHRARVRREVQALRALNIAGVVRLLDVGEHLGEPYLVTELLEGAPFPGRYVERTWAGIASRTLSLLQTLAQVHAAGFVHRDLKPENILVADDGRVTVLDFGLVRDLEPGGTVTGGGAGPVGTPRYLSPEQLLGHRVDARADLYAVGVMLFELLAGRPPLPDEGFWPRVLQRHVPSAPSLASVVPDVDPTLAAVVDQLLAVNPVDRPPSAHRLLQSLGELDRPDSIHRPVRLPLVGRDRELKELLADARCGVSRDLWGPPGSGRSRLLQEAVYRLRQEGREVVWLVAGRAPLSSLAPLLGTPSTPDPLPELALALRDRLGAGLVVVTDDPAALDRFSRRVLDECRSAGAILRIADTPGALVLGPLPSEALRALFHGPDRVLHLREDAAEELHERTGGLPGRVAAELNAWVGARLCAWEEGRLRIRRAELDQLRGGLLVGPAGGWSYAEPAGLDESSAELLGWIVLGGGALDAPSLAVASEGRPWEVRVLLDDLVARGFVRQRRDGRLDALVAPPQLQSLGEEVVLDRHRAIANALPRGTEARLRQWMLVGEAEAVAEEALEVARGLLLVGRALQAAATLAAVWAGGARSARGEPSLRFASLWTAAAIESASLAQVEGALAHLRDVKTAGIEVTLLGAYLDSVRGRLAEARAEAARLGVLANPALEVHRLAILVRAATESGESPEVVFAGLDPYHSPEVGERKLTWLGMWAYQRGEFEQAAAFHADAAERSPHPLRKVVCRINQASALLDADRAESALLLAEFIAAESRALGMPSLEAWGWGVRRCATVRIDRGTPPDLEWIAVSRDVGPVQRHAHACLVEAGAAWRSGMDGQALTLAEESAATFGAAGREELWVLPAALAMFLGGAVPSELDERVRQALALGRAPRFAAQAAELLARRGCREAVHSLFVSSLRHVVRERARLDVLTYPDDAVALRFA